MNLQEFKQSQLLRNQKVANGAIIWDWTPAEFFTSILSPKH